MKNRIIIIFIFFVFQYSCISDRKYGQENKLYNEIKESCIDTTIFNDFPVQFSKNTRPLSVISPKVINHGLDYFGFFLQINQPAENIQEKFDHYIQSNTIYEYNDTCLWKIQRSGTALDVNSNCRIPIPDIEEQNNVLSSLVCANEVGIIILDYTFTRVLSDVYLHQCHSSILSQGYSNGIIVDSKNDNVFLFFIIWLI